MSDRPMGFGPPGDDDRPDDEQGGSSGSGGPGGSGSDDPSGAGFDPFALLGSGNPDDIARALRAAGAGDVDAAQVRQMMDQVQRMMAAPSEGPVNWTLAGDVARQVVSESGDASVTGPERRAVEDALRLADTWLGPATTLPAAGTRTEAWSRAEWVEGTRPVWRRLVEPVAENVGRALTDALGQQLGRLGGEGGLPGMPGVPGLPPELAGALPGGLGGLPGGQDMITQLGGSVFGMQVGQAIGTLATEVVSGTEIGLPLVDPGTVVLLPAGVLAFGEGLDVPADEVRLYLAVRESARSRLFAHVPWLAPSLLGAVEAYARGISIDTERIESALRMTDATDPASLQQAFSEGLFEPERTPAQQAALDRLETQLALVEGWVEVVTDEATRSLPHAGALRETVRRRRAIGGPAEQTFGALVGLELRPRRLRDAAALWRLIGDDRGVDGRDAVWSHPDLLPTAQDLDDPMGYAERRQASADESASLDAAIEQLLSGEDDA